MSSMPSYKLNFRKRIASLVRMQNNALQSRLTNGIKWSLMGMLFSQGFALLTSVIQARILQLETYGKLSIINLTIVTLGSFAGFGLGITTNRYVAMLRDKDPLRTRRIIGMTQTIALITGATCALTIVLFSHIITQNILEDVSLTTALRISALLLIINPLAGIQNGVLSGIEEFRTQAKLVIISSIINLTAIVTGALLGGLPGTIIGYVIGALLSWAIGEIIVIRLCHTLNIRPSFSGLRQESAIIWSFCVPALITAISTQPFMWASRFIVSQQDNGYQELALFTAAFSWTNLILFLPRQISRVSMPILSNLHGSRKTEQIRGLIFHNLMITLILSSLSGLPLIIFSRVIMSTYGTNFKDGAVPLIFLSIAYIIGAETLVLRDLLASIGKMWVQAVQSIGWGIILIISSILLSHRGALGLSQSYLISYIALFISQAIVLSLWLWNKGAPLNADL